MKSILKTIPRSVYGIFPFLLGSMLVLAAILPVQIPYTETNLGPYIVLAVIFHSAVRYTSSLPAIAVFILGLGYDMLSSGPLGYWALIYLSVHMISNSQKYLLGKERLLGCLVAFAVICCLGGLLSWALGSIFYGHIASFKEIIWGVLNAILIYPLAYFILIPVDRRLMVNSLQGFSRA